MGRVERTVIVSLIAVAVPVFALAGCWFSLLGILLLLGSSSVSPTTGMSVLGTGLLGGIAIDILRLKRWAGSIYEADLRLMTFLFLVCSLLTIAMGMGVPVGNGLLGILAGLYMGRRTLHEGGPPESVDGVSRKVARLTGVVIAAVAFPVGLLALFAGEEETVRSLLNTVGIPFTMGTGVGLIVILCLVLLLGQYVLTRVACLFAYGGWSSVDKNVKCIAGRK